MKTHQWQNAWIHHRHNQLHPKSIHGSMRKTNGWTYQSLSELNLEWVEWNWQIMKIVNESSKNTRLLIFYVLEIVSFKDAVVELSHWRGKIVFACFKVVVGIILIRLVLNKNKNKNHLGLLSGTLHFVYWYFIVCSTTPGTSISL